MRHIEGLGRVIAELFDTRRSRSEQQIERAGQASSSETESARAEKSTDILGTLQTAVHEGEKLNGKVGFCYKIDQVGKGKDAEFFTRDVNAEREHLLMDYVRAAGFVLKDRTTDKGKITLKFTYTG